MSGKNTGVGCHLLLQGLFPTHGSNAHLPHWQADSFPLATWEAQREQTGTQTHEAGVNSVPTVVYTGFSGDTGGPGVSRRVRKGSVQDMEATGFDQNHF